MKGIWKNNKTGKKYLVTGSRYDATDVRKARGMKCL